MMDFGYLAYQMQSTDRNSMFITFEGIDQSGKTTQATMLAERLRRDGRTVVFLREPGGTALSERIRSVLLEKDHCAIGPLAELLLFSAARAQLVNEVIRPALAAGQVVICDRFHDSTTAYQGHGRGLSLNDVRTINRVVISGTAPDLTFFITVDFDEVVRRRHHAGQQADRMESSGREFYERVAEGYAAIVREEPDRSVVIDGTQSPSVIHDRIWDVIQKRFSH